MWIHTAGQRSGEWSDPRGVLSTPPHLAYEGARVHAPQKRFGHTWAVARRHGRVQRERGLRDLNRGGIQLWRRARTDPSNPPTTTKISRPQGRVPGYEANPAVTTSTVPKRESKTKLMLRQLASRPTSDCSKRNSPISSVRGRRRARSSRRHAPAGHAGSSLCMPLPEHIKTCISTSRVTANQ